MKNIYLEEGFNREIVCQIMFSSEKRKIGSSEKTERYCYAYILVDGQRKMCMMNPDDTSKAFKLDGYARTEKMYNNFTFDRWCRGMDL